MHELYKYYLGVSAGQPCSRRCKITILVPCRVNIISQPLLLFTCTTVKGPGSVLVCRCFWFSSCGVVVELQAIATSHFVVFAGSGNSGRHILGTFTLKDGPHRCGVNTLVMLDEISRVWVKAVRRRQVHSESATTRTRSEARNEISLNLNLQSTPSHALAAGLLQVSLLTV